MMTRADNTNKTLGLVWPELLSGTLIKRYKRFLADVKLDSGKIITAHCPNTGSMQACCEPGRPVYVSVHDNPKRKLKYTWEIISMPTSLVGVNTLVPNRLMFKSIKDGLVDELKGYEQITREVKVGNHSRLDLMLANSDRDRCYVEIKNCTLVSEGEAFFPDAITTRGLKHISELRRLAAKGYRSVMFYFIQRMDASVFKLADHIDPDYGNGLRQAVKKGVEVLVYDVSIDMTGIRLNRKIPYDFF